MLSLHYGHYIMDNILGDISRVSDKDTEIFIWDYYRTVPWDVILAGANRHLKLVNPLITPEEMADAVTRSPLELVTCLDFTENILRPHDLMSAEAMKRDPEQKTLMYPVVRDAFYSKSLKYVIFNLKLRG